MKRILLLAAMAFCSQTMFAQHGGMMGGPMGAPHNEPPKAFNVELDGKPLTDADVVHTIALMQKINQLPDADIAYMKTHDYKDNPNDPFYNKIKAMAAASGFTGYQDAQQGMMKTFIGYGMSQMPPGAAAQMAQAKPQMDAMLNNPNIPDNMKENIKQGMKMMEQMSKTAPQDQAILKPHMAEIKTVVDAMQKRYGTMQQQN